MDLQRYENNLEKSMRKEETHTVSDEAKMRRQIKIALIALSIVELVVMIALVIRKF